jgi:malonyl-CoA/methylmalonyl-CoA synthetase
VGPGDRVAAVLPKSAAAVVLHLACLRAGAVHLPVNPGATDDELAHVVADAEPAVVLRTVDDPLLAGPGSSTPGWVDDVLVDLDQPAALLYTSGTTGLPKGVLLSHGNLLHNARTLADAWGFTGPELPTPDALLHVLPLHHTHGLFVALHCALAGAGSALLLEQFDPADAVALLPATTVLMGVPTHYVRLLDEPGFDAHATASLRLMTSGSAPMPAALHGRLRERTGQQVVERYGMTETSILTSNPLYGERRPGSVGPALPGVGVRVVDEGDVSLPAGSVGAVQVLGPNVSAGYWRRPELRAADVTADGWFRTGDLGWLADDGYLTLVGRTKDLVISGGLNVYPAEVEAVLDAHPAVRESAVVGVPDPDLGEAAVAVLVAADPGAGVDVEAVRAAARQRLAGYKVPRRLVVVDELPRNAMGKVEKARLRAMLAP